MVRDMMALAATAGTLSLATAAAAAAAPIVYSGSKTVTDGSNTIMATYSITTDGTLGSNLDIGTHVTGFSISLNDGITTYGYNHTVSGGTGSAYGSLTATATSLRIGGLDAGLYSNSNGFSAAGSALGLFNISNIGSTAQISDASHTTYVRAFDFATGASPFAFAAAAPVPEATTWAMLIVGVGAIGVAMRRQRVRTTVRFA